MIKKKFSPLLLVTKVTVVEKGKKKKSYLEQNTKKFLTHPYNKPTQVNLQQSPRKHAN